MNWSKGWRGFLKKYVESAKYQGGLVSSAFTNFTGKIHWHSLLKARAIETGCYILAPAQQGIHPDGRKTFGHTIVIDPWGRIINECNNKENIIISEIDINKVYSARNSIPSLKLNVKI